MSKDTKPSKSSLKALMLIELTATAVFVYLGLTAKERPWSR